MKPTFQFTEASRQKGFKLPKTDFSFQPASATQAGGCFKISRPSFHSISQGYFEGEARRDFASEAVLFAVMIVTAALPIVASIIALTGLVRSFGAL